MSRAEVKRGENDEELEAAVMLAGKGGQVYRDGGSTSAPTVIGRRGGT